MAYVAAGRCDGFWQRNLNYWDIAAGIIIVKESGGFVTDFKGENGYIQNKTILVTNAKINNEMIEDFKIVNLLLLIISFYYTKLSDMKKKIHPDYHKIKVVMTDGSEL